MNRLWTLDLRLWTVFSGCGVTSASESWELVATVQFCPSRPRADCGLRIEECRFINPKSAILNLKSPCSCSSIGRVRRFERRGCGFEPCQEFQQFSRE